MKYVHLFADLSQSDETRFRQILKSRSPETGKNNKNQSPVLSSSATASSQLSHFGVAGL